MSLEQPEEAFADYGEEEEVHEGEEDGAYDEIEDIKRRVKEMEEENSKLTQIQQSVDKELNSVAYSIDENSMYVRLLSLSSCALKLSLVSAAMLVRSITKRHRRSFERTLHHAEKSNVQPYFVISTLGTPKGKRALIFISYFFT